jgi:hypothetical protein
VLTVDPEHARREEKLRITGQLLVAHNERHRPDDNSNHVYAQLFQHLFAKS